MESQTLRDAFVAAGQGHAFERLERLDERGRAKLAEQLEALDLELLAHLRALIDGSAAPHEAPRRFEPPELFPLARTAAQQEELERARARGAELVDAGKVGYVLVAGGQASRLGYDGPKGAFPVGPVTGRSLFEVHARRLLRAARGGEVPVPYYVMTSPANDAATKDFFEAHDFFGLKRDEVFFFSQDMLPALDEGGRIVFTAPDELFLAPNGHGGLLLGLDSSGAIADMRARGLEQLSYFQVDNPLVRPVDPAFLGLHDLARAGMSTKVVVKRDAAEKVGVIGRMDRKLGCIEYSDLPDDLREARDDDGQLRFRAGNTAVHALSVDFAERVSGAELELPWHVARKKMRVLEPDGSLRERTGFKFEAFVFDALALSPESVTMEADRALEFSPVKNADGQDSPASARADLCRLYAEWLRAAGRELPPADADGNHPVEIDPLFADSLDELLAKSDLEPQVTDDGHYYG